MRTRYLLAALVAVVALPAQAQLTTYSTLAAFNAAFPANTLEDFNDLNDGGLIACTPGPWTSTTSDAVVSPGDLPAGVTLTAVGVGNMCAGGPFWQPALPSTAALPDSFTDLFEIGVPAGTREVAFEIINANQPGTGTATVEVYNGATLIGSATISGVNPTTYTFFGVYATATTITRIVIGNPTGGAENEITDNLRFGSQVIPVELTSFTGTADGTSAELRWTTASETNNAGFEVQALRGTEWTALGFVDGHGTTTEAQSYAFRANALAAGTHVFRLRQVDFDGAFELTDEVEVTVGVPGTHVLSQAYPNPFNPQTSFTLAVSSTQHVAVEVFNTLGQRVAVAFEGTMEANQTQELRINGSSLASGAYVVRVTGETFQDALRISLLK